MRLQSQIVVASPSGYAREVFAVEGTRVTLDSRRGWQCECGAEARGLECTHIERAEALKLMRGTPLGEDTVELQLSADQLRILWESPALEVAPSAPAEVVRKTRREARSSRWTHVVTAAAIAVISSCITYLSVTRAQSVPVPEHLISVSTPISVPEAAPATPPPVIFVNPFDSSEVFELPPGTSESGARDTVAELLMQRARDRMAGSTETPRQVARPVNREKLGRGINLAQRG